jgi:hypothetical protein
LESKIFKWIADVNVQEHIKALEKTKNDRLREFEQMKDTIIRLYEELEMDPMWVSVSVKVGKKPVKKNQPSGVIFLNISAKKENI